MKNKMEQSKIFRKRKLMNDICYYMVGTQKKHYLVSPHLVRRYLDNICIMSTAEYENSHIKKLGFKDAKESAKNAFKEDMEISDLLKMVRKGKYQILCY